MVSARTKTKPSRLLYFSSSVADNEPGCKRTVDGAMFSRDGWHHPRGSGLIGWVKHYRNSPIVYLQCGDDHVAYRNPHFRQLLHNAIRWVSSDEAHDWARARHRQDQITGSSAT